MSDIEMLDYYAKRLRVLTTFAVEQTYGFESEKQYWELLRAAERLTKLADKIADDAGLFDDE